VATTTGLHSARRPKGTGTLSEVGKGSGVWRLRVFVGKDPVTGVPRQVSRTIRTAKRSGKTEAQAALRKLVAEVAAGKHVGTSANLSVLLDHWLAECKRKGRSPNTLETYRQHVERRLKPRLGDVRLSDLTAHHLDRFYAELDAEGLKPGTIRLFHSMLSGALSLAVRWSWIAQSPAMHASPPPPTRPTDDGALTPAVVLSLIGEADKDDQDMATLLTLAALTGMRRGELCGLRWSDVDAEHQAIRISRALVPGKGGQHERPPKGGETRVVALGSPGLALLARYRAILLERTGREPNGWLLSYDGGTTPMRAKSVTEYVAALGLRLDPPLKVHLHLTRHFSVTQLLGAGVDLLAVSRRHGHSSVAITGDIYGHALPARDQYAANVLAKVLELDP
jgi:integrase